MPFLGTITECHDCHCGLLAIEEAATFCDGRSLKTHKPAVSVHKVCEKCGQSYLDLRLQESIWIRSVWKLPLPKQKKLF